MLAYFLKIFKKDLLLKKIDQKFKSLFPDTFVGISLYSSFLKAFNYFSYNQRKNIFKKNFNNIPKNHSISDQKGYKIIQLKKVSTKKILNKINFNKVINHKLPSKKKFLKTYPIDIFSEDFVELKGLILSEEFIKPIINYLGSVPLLWNCALWISPNQTFETGRSQEFHLDNEDVKQIKCFVPLEDITKDSGPLNIIDAENSKDIFNKLQRTKKVNYKSQKVSDQEMYKLFNKKDKITLLAKKGDVIMLDTSRCYHYGSRPGKKPRKLLFFQFLTINAKKISIFQSFQNKEPNNIEENIFLFHKLNRHATS